MTMNEDIISAYLAYHDETENTLDYSYLEDLLWNNGESNEKLDEYVAHLEDILFDNGVQIVIDDDIVKEVYGDLEY